MNKYRVVYQRSDGTRGEEVVYAVNRTMAFEVFKDFDYQDVVNADVFRVIDEEEDDE